MGLTGADRGTALRSDELRTKRDIARTFVAHRSPQTMLVGLTAAVVLRLIVSGYGWSDVVVVAATIALVGAVEWVLHLFLLHAPDDSLRMSKLGTGSGHREHHLDPLNVGWIMLGGVDAFIFLLLIAAWTAVWSIPLLALIGGPLLGPFLTATVAAYVSLAHYEWVHLLVHTRYRAKSRYYRRLTTNHRLHHYRNERYWLGVTSNLGDRLMGTYPADKSDVPLSDTARTLA